MLSQILAYFSLIKGCFDKFGGVFSLIELRIEIESSIIWGPIIKLRIGLNKNWGPIIEVKINIALP